MTTSLGPCTFPFQAQSSAPALSVDLCAAKITQASTIRGQVFLDCSGEADLAARAGVGPRGLSELERMRVRSRTPKRRGGWHDQAEAAARRHLADERCALAWPRADAMSLALSTTSSGPTQTVGGQPTRAAIQPVGAEPPLAGRGRGRVR